MGDGTPKVFQSSPIMGGSELNYFPSLPLPLQCLPPRHPTNAYTWLWHPPFLGVSFPPSTPQFQAHE